MDSGAEICLRVPHPRLAPLALLAQTRAQSLTPLPHPMGCVLGEQCCPLTVGSARPLCPPSSHAPIATWTLLGPHESLSTGPDAQGQGLWGLGLPVTRDQPLPEPPARGSGSSCPARPGLGHPTSVATLSTTGLQPRVQPCCIPASLAQQG